jgi:hypothetical protein
VGTIAVLIGMLWLARRIDPHWVAKDGRSFTCRLQPIRLPGAMVNANDDRQATLSDGRWRNGRGVVIDDRVVVSSRRATVGQQPLRHLSVIGRGTDPPKRQVTFLLGGDPNYLVMIPASSRAVAVLDSIADRTAP